MSNKLFDEVKKQINKELYSSYLYLSMSSWCSFEGWKGFSSWLYIQAKEEAAHAMVLHNHLLERGVHSTFESIEAPPKTWNNVLEMFENVYSHEQNVTKGINNLATIALEENDHTFYQFIQMFLNEQIEEEANSSDIIVRLKRFGDNISMYEMMDKELGARTFTSPFPNYTF